MAVYDDMFLYINALTFIIEPIGRKEQLHIDRQTREATVLEKTGISDGAQQTQKICGILGSIQLISGYYLIVATHRKFIGLINNEPIWILAGHSIIPYKPYNSNLSTEQAYQNDVYLEMLHKLLSSQYFYFSYSYDLTHTIQRLNSMPPEFKQMEMIDRADQRFVWNSFALTDLRRMKIRNFCLPLLHGFVSINEINIGSRNFQWTLISRRSVQRAGTRLFCRGIDQNGFCANYVETEQIVEYIGDKLSFVQIRGSIPMFWSQLPTLQYKPKPKINLTQDHEIAARKHIETQLQQYGRLVFVNLIDHRGAEEHLEKGFATLIAQFNNTAVRYESFDFHAECKHLRWDRLNILIDRLSHELDEFSFFHLRRDGTPLSYQDGIFRTNCIDCLDRTNVVQSMLAKRSLERILHKLGILNENDRIENHVMLEMLYKNVWADNADMVSIQYSGTGALKTDYTRTGKRTVIGALRDGLNSMIRYYKNNFNDGFRQDSIDLFLGNYVVQEMEQVSVSPKGWKSGTFPTVLLVAIVMFCASAIFPREYNTENMLFIMFWGSMIGVTAAGIFKNGSEFVDWPKLVPSIKNQA